MMDVLIYVLRDPRDRSVRYLGRTTDAERRKREHAQARRSSRRDAWVRELRACGLRPTMQVIDRCGSDWPLREAEWIALLADHGAHLLNESLGGDGVAYATVTPEFRRKISAAVKGKSKPSGFGVRVSAALKGRPRGWSDAGRAKVAATQFKPGVDAQADLPPDRRAALNERRSAAAKSLSKEERSRRNRVAWAALTPEQRAARGRAIAEGQRAARAKKAKT